MSSYLDKPGLTYFWGKIKAYVATVLPGIATRSTDGLMSSSDKQTLDILSSNPANFFRFTSTANMISTLSEYANGVFLFRGSVAFGNNLGGALANRTSGGVVYKLDSTNYDMVLISNAVAYRVRYTDEQTPTITIARLG